MAGVGTNLSGKYVLVERIGAGGVGVVYRAEQPALSRCVAVKLLHHSLAGDADALRRFRTEAFAASRVGHPSSVMVFDHGMATDGTPYLVMEYVAGESLRAVLRRDRWLPLGRAVAIVREILAGLGEAHRSGVVHGDVKTDNILVEQLRDGSDRVKLVDYGLAELAHDAASVVLARTRSEWTVCGTPEYMAPEVIRGEPMTARADLYAAGIVLYELLTGATPFVGGTTHDVMYPHVHDEVVLPSLRRPDLGLPRELEAVVLRALAKRPTERFADAAAFSAAMAEVPMTGGGAVRCEACGESRPRGARFCTACGTLAGDVAPARGADAITKVARGSTRIVARTVATELRRLRTAIGAAIVDGDPARIATGYLALARQLSADERFTEGIRELEEALELLAGGARGTGSRSPERARLGAALIGLRAARHAAIEVAEADPTCHGGPAVQARAIARPRQLR